MKFVLKKKLPKMKEKGKSWYNSECTNTKKRLQNHSRLLMKNPTDPFIRGQYCKVKKGYGKTMKFHRILFEKNAVDRLESLSSNPKKFWSFLKSIGGHLNGINLEKITYRLLIKVTPHKCMVI